MQEIKEMESKNKKVKVKFEISPFQSLVFWLGVKNERYQNVLKMQKRFQNFVKWKLCGAKHYCKEQREQRHMEYVSLTWC